MSAPTRLVPLPQQPEALDQILAWNLDVWGERIPGYDAPAWRAFYERCLVADYDRYDGASELAWVLVREGHAIGSIALVHEDDLPEFIHLSPWMAAFVIDPALRGQGIGRGVVAEFERVVRGYGISTLYLWTDSLADWYRQLGYHVLAHGRIGEIEMDVMAKALSDLEG